MSVHVQPHPIRAGRAGFAPPVLYELPPRQAVYAWCEAQGLGWCWVRQLGDTFHGAMLFEAEWPRSAGGQVYRLVVSR